MQQRFISLTPRKERRLSTRFSLAFSFLFIFSFILAACGGEPQQSGPVTLTFGWWANTPAKDEAMKAWIKDFESSHPDIKIKPEILPWTNYWDKLKTTTAGGNAYDIIGMCSCYAAPYFDRGALVDLSTEFADFAEASANLDEQSMKLSQWDDKTYSLPVGTSISVLGYNKELLDEAGVPYPDPVKPMTYDEFIEIAKKLTKVEDGKVTQYALNPASIIDADVMVRMAGGQLYDNPVNPTKIMVNTPEGIKGLEAYKKLFDEKVIPSPEEQGNGPWSYDLGALQTGKIAFARVGPWLFNDMQKEGKYGVTPFFTMEESVIASTANSLAIFKGSKYKEQAWEFLKWATQTEAEIAFAKFSDVPSDKAAFDQMDSYLEPKEYIPTVKVGLEQFQPAVMTTKEDVRALIDEIVTDMANGKVTPEQAAQRMEEEGNAILAS